MGEDLDRFLLKFQAKTAAAVVRQFDLSTAKATLVTSAPGMRSIDNMLMGLPRLGEAIRKIDPEDKGGPLLYTCSSIGKLDEKWMWDFYMSVYPDYAKAGAAEFEGLPPVTVLYPSADTVKGHEGASNFVWFNKAYYEDKTFPRSILRDVVSRRKTVIHAKASPRSIVALIIFFWNYIFHNRSCVPTPQTQSGSTSAVTTCLPRPGARRSSQISKRRRARGNWLMRRCPYR